MGNGLERFHRSVKVLHDLGGQHFRIGQILTVLQRAVAEPQEVQVQLVALSQFVVLERPPTAALVLRAPRRLPHVALARPIAGHEVVEVRSPERLHLEREVLVGAQVVDPEPLGLRLLARGLGVEEQEVGLHPLGIEDPGRKPE